MPRPIQYTRSEGRTYVPPSSRYHKAPVIVYDGRLTYPVYKKKNVSFHPEDQHYEITRDTEFRPDLVSYQFFSTPDFWWRIMEMNRMKDVLEFRAGRNIILPGSSLLA